MTHRHSFDVPPTTTEMEAGDWLRHCRCGRREHPEATAKARSSVRLGKDQERRIERVYGPTKVGERGGAVDLIGRDFKWQSKATRGPVPKYLAKLDGWGAIEAYAWILDPFWLMLDVPKRADLYPELAPLLIRSFVHVGLPVRDYIIVRAEDWVVLHGERLAPMFAVMTGAYFLEVHGKDTRQEGPS